MIRRSSKPLTNFTLGRRVTDDVPKRNRKYKANGLVKTRRVFYSPLSVSFIETIFVEQIKGILLNEN